MTNRPISFRHRQFIRKGTLILACLAFFQSEYSMSESKPANTPNSINTRGGLSHSVGRFDFVLPASWRLTGRDQRIYMLKVWNENIDSSTSPKQLWETHLSVLKSNATALQPDALIREISLQGGLSGAWSQASPRYPDDLKLLVMKPMADHTLFLEAEASVGRESIAEEVVAEVANGYVPSSPDGFSVGNGAFVMKPSEDEHAGSSFINEEGLELSIKTDTVAEPIAEISDSEDQGDAEAIREAGGKLQVLSKRPRVVADLPGQERRVQLKDKEKKSELVYFWACPGQPSNGLQPRILIQGSSPLARRMALDSAWDQLLDSFRKRRLGLP